ncbi:MAG: four helix bundle protein [Acidobacteriota bacterium]
MATFTKFEDIKAWQKAREVTRTIYELTANDRFARDFGLRDQIRRAAVSIMANIAEGFGRHSDKEFSYFLSMSHGSIAEVQSHLYIALDLRYIEQKDFSMLYRSLDETSRMTLALAQHLRKPKP